MRSLQEPGERESQKDLEGSFAHHPLDREHVGRASSKVSPGLKNAHAVEYCLAEKRDKPHAVGRVEWWSDVESVKWVLNRRERLTQSQSTEI